MMRLNKPILILSVEVDIMEYCIRLRMDSSQYLICHTQEHMNWNKSMHSCGDI